MKQKIFVVTVCDRKIRKKIYDRREEIAVIEITEEYMKDRLYEFRGEKVMLDSDLAEIYGYETKNFKRQVKNNIAKFEGDDFMFELDDEEVEKLSRRKNFTLNMGRDSNIKYKPYVFTEQGVSKYAPIIATLLKNPTLILPQ